MVDNMEDLEEVLLDLLGDGFQLDVDSEGQVIIYTGLRETDDGELEKFVSDDDLEEDLDIDPDLEQLDLDDEE
jgi:hypothetical protein